MRYLALLCLVLLSACASPAFNWDTMVGDNMVGDNSIDVGGPPLVFHAENYPPQCNPAASFPDGKVPADFMTNADRPEYQRFEDCLNADARAHATGKDVLFYMPESELKTECAAADQYPDHKVRPGFYGYPSPPEFDRYVECLIAEAHRDGDRVRLASPLSFPKVGACYSARVTDLGFGGPEGHRKGNSTFVSFDNGLNLFDYGYIAPVEHLHIGDTVRQCVHDLPKDCPSHDLRGIGYRITLSRTGEHFVMFDSAHECRGA